jgi:hypothetical protein|tara:strand:- start:175 stop:738 length:564 start_codon:yes stop_codon:yes gene_type:complete
MTKNRYVFTTELEGFVNCGEPSGTYNNCSFAFKLPASVLVQAEKDREELLEWAKSKTGSSRTTDPKWSDDYVVKYSFDGDTGRPRPVFVDTSGDVVSKDIQASIRKGTKVKVICQQTPYTKPKAGTTIKVLGVQIIELVTGSGATDSGNLTVDDIKDMFGTADGFKADSPAVTKADATPASVESYDF